LYKHAGVEVIILPSGSLQEPQPAQAESLLPTKPMEQIARKNREIEQLQMQLKAKIKESELTIQDLEDENQVLKWKLFQEEEENKSALEKVQCRFWQLLCLTSEALYFGVSLSLSEPDTSVTSYTCACVCLFACLLGPSKLF